MSTGNTRERGKEKELLIISDYSLLCKSTGVRGLSRVVLFPVSQRAHTNQTQFSRKVNAHLWPRCWNVTENQFEVRYFGFNKQCYRRLCSYPSPNCCKCYPSTDFRVCEQPLMKKLNHVSCRRCYRLLWEKI